jgi:hypothetical protein
MHFSRRLPRYLLVIPGPGRPAARAEANLDLSGRPAFMLLFRTMTIARPFSLICASALLLLGFAAERLAAQDFQPLAYVPAPIDNPLKGFVPYDTDSGQGNFPHSLEWFYLPLADLMPAAKTFDWQPLEKHLTAIAGRGHHAVMRIYLDYPGKTPGTPRFLLEAGVTARPYDGRKNSGKSVSPNYEDPRLRAALTDFIAAFGARYDGDPRLGFITIGLLGYWGEWHTSDHREWFASKPVQKEVMDAYLRAFHRTRLLARYPAGPDDSYYADNHELALGYHDDSFAYATRPTGDPNSWFFLDRMTRSGALEKWRTQPIGGEVRPEVWDTLWDDPTGAPKGQEYNPSVDATHATWLMNTGVFRPALEGARRERALAGARRMGYELYVESAALAATADGELRVGVRLRNTGVAPFYYAWPVQLGLLGPSGKVATWPTDWKLTRVAPDAAPLEFDSVWIGASGVAGEYRVLLRIMDPLPQGRPLRFANQAQDKDQPGWLTLGRVHFAR